jgi:hypothetical protein
MRAILIRDGETDPATDDLASAIRDIYPPCTGVAWPAPGVASASSRSWRPSHPPCRPPHRYCRPVSRPRRRAAIAAHPTARECSVLDLRNGSHPTKAILLASCSSQ